MLKKVKASAGSGKTHALTTAFLELLAQSVDEPPLAGCGRGSGACAWPEILAVTFTNKAASEMKERILRSLKQRVLDPGRSGPGSGMSPAEARKRLEAVIRRLSSLNVRTIDSLLHLLVGQAALDLGLPPRFEPLFDVKELFTPAYDAFLARAEDEESLERGELVRACQAVFRIRPPGGFRPGVAFREELLRVVKFRLENPGLERVGPDILLKEYAGLVKRLKERAGEARRTAEGCGLILAKNFVKFLDKCLGMSELDQPPKSAYADKEGLAECVLTKSRSNLTGEAEEAYSRLKRALAGLAGEGGTLLKAAALSPLDELALIILEDIEQRQKTSGKVLSLRWPEYAQGLMSGEFGASEAFCRMGTRLGRLLIDEFQDTSQAQWDTLAPLAEEALSKGGGLFYVGDVKQAIYGWRGGEASLFDRAAETPGLAMIAGGKAETETLPVNWRSAPAIVRFNNEFFSRMAGLETALELAQAMLPKAMETAAGEMAAELLRTFADAPQEVRPDWSGPQGLVRLYDVRGADKEDLAQKVRERLKEVVDSLLARRRPGELAVLVRKNDQAAMVAEWLIEWGIPVITENSLRLADHPLVRQIIALLRFLDYPLDDLSFWEFIANPEILPGDNRPDPELIPEWAALASREDQHLYKCFQRDFPRVWEEHVAPFHSRAGLTGPYDMAVEIVLRFGLIERNPGDELYIRRFLETVHAAEEKGALSLSSFLEFWREQGAAEKAPLPENVDAVRVMTIHKAKGLEFPVVVVPFNSFSAPKWGGLAGIEVEIQGRKKTILSALHSRLGPEHSSLVIPDLCEQSHILYVAWTRPSEELHAFLTSTKEKKGGGNEEVEPESELKGLEILVRDYPPGPEGFYQYGEVPESRTVPGPQVQAEEARPALGPRPSGDRLMGWLPRLKIFRSPLDQALSEERRRGILAHACLEGLSRADPDLDPAVAAPMVVEAVLLPWEEKREELREELLSMLGWFAAQPGMLRALRGGRPEMTILDREGKVLRADLYYQDDKERLVLEYKTGRADPAHERQLRGYLRALPGPPGDKRPLKGILAYLDEKRLRTVELEGPDE